MAESFRKLLRDQTSIDPDDTLDARQKAVVADTIRRVAELPEFRDAYAALMIKKAQFNITSVQNQQLIDSNGDGVPDGRANSTLYGKINGQVVDGGELIMTLHRQRGGVDIPDRELARQVAHELIHAFAVAEWDIKVDTDKGWVDRVLNAAFGDQAAQAGPGMPPVAFTPFQFAGPNGGALTAGTGEEALIGSVAADVFHTGPGKAHIFSGEGDDTIVLRVGGDIAVIVDDAGQDVIALPQASAADDVRTRWSADGQDLAVVVDGVMEAIIVNAVAKSVETLRVGTTNHTIASLTSGTNVAPVITSSLFEVIGTHQGLVGRVRGHDADADPITYRLAEIAGAYADQPWRLGADGHIYADFMRLDAPGSEFTDLRVIASDRLDATEMWLSVRWGSAGSPNPELSRPADPIDQEPVGFWEMGVSPDLHLI